MNTLVNAQHSRKLALFIESPQLLIYVTIGAILLGWFVGKMGAYLGNKFKAPARDPRDARILSLEADQRVAHTQLDQTQTSLGLQSKSLAETQALIGERDQIITDQHRVVRQLKDDLKDSVLKTRELRRELSQRAAEDLKSQVRLRDVETELSVAQASTDLIATGVLDYSVAPDPEGNDEDRGRLVAVKTKP